MPNTNGTCSINSRQQETFTVTVYDKDGHLDETSALNVSMSTGCASVSLGPDGRNATIVGNVVGSGNCQITVIGANAQSVFVAVTVTAAPDIRHMDLTPGPIVDKP